MKNCMVCFVVVLCLACPAYAEFQLNVFSAEQSSYSTIRGDTAEFPGLTSDWDGRFGQASSDSGFRLTWWQDDRLGYGFELDRLALAIYTNDFDNINPSDLQFDSGANLLTLNGFKRWGQPDQRLKPYIGGGLGIIFSDPDATGEYRKVSDQKISGPAMVLIAGASYEIAERWWLFGEYKGSYASKPTDINVDDQQDVDMIENSVNVGLTFNF